MTQIRPITHEAKGNLYYAPIEPGSTDWDGLDPYWALTGLLLDSDGYLSVDDVSIDGESWDVRLNYHVGGIQPRADDPIDAEGLYEFDITVRGPGQRGGSYQVRPRFERMRTTSGDELTTPFGHVADAGVSVQFQTSNMALAEIRDLFPRFLAELFAADGRGLYHGYFDRPVGGRIAEIERYVRITRHMCQKLTQQGGEF